MATSAKKQQSIRKISLSELPDAEQCLDRDGLETLLLAGLRPADIAERHGVTRRHVAGLAKRWALDTRALRARQRSVAALRPDLASEFLCDVSGGAVPVGADGLTLGSGRRCRWRCHRCEHEWETTVVNRAVHGSGCPQCAKGRLRERALEDRARTPNLAIVRADLMTEFVRNLTVPTREFHETPAGSHDRILWRCRFGHEWIAVARQRVKYRTNCPGCRPGFRS